MPGLNLGLGLGLASPSKGDLYPEDALTLDWTGARGRPFFKRNGVIYPSFAAMVAAGAASYSRTGAATIIDPRDGTIRTFAANEVREILGVGMVVEETRTNLLRHYGPTAVQFPLRDNVSDTTAPASPPMTGINWVAINNSGVTGYAYQTATLAASTAHAMQFLCETPDGSQPVGSQITTTGDFTLNLGSATGVAVTWSYQRLTGNVWRVIAVATSSGAPGANTGLLRYTTQNTRVLKFSGFDVQASSAAKSPVITTGASATVGADNPLILGLAALQAQCANGMTLLAEVAGETPGVAFAGIAGLTDGALSNRATLQRGASGNLSSRATFNSVAASPGDVTWPAGTGVKRMGLSIAPGRAIACINGTLGTASSPIAVPLFTQLGIGISDPGGGLVNLDAFIHRIRVIPRTFSDAELQAAA